MINEIEEFFNNDYNKNFYGLRERFLEPVFSVLDTKTGSWQNRKRKWKSLGIQGEIGRENKGNSAFNNLKIRYIDNDRPRNKGKNFAEKVLQVAESNSTFDPALTELMYHWFCKKEGKILDPFAGGSVRGIVANYLNYKYTGIELRKEQVLENVKQADLILKEKDKPNWIVGDSDTILDSLNEKFDFIFTCPPYYNLEIYSDEEGDLSNLQSYELFIEKYFSIIKKSCSLLNEGCYACFVIGEIRDKKGNYYGFVPDTINCFKKVENMYYYNEAILLNQISSASLRAINSWKNKKLSKVHQNVLIFKKGMI